MTMTMTKTSYKNGSSKHFKQKKVKSSHYHSQKEKLFINHKRDRNDKIIQEKELLNFNLGELEDCYISDEYIPSHHYDGYVNGVNDETLLISETGINTKSYLKREKYDKY
jgi:hypothetical protein